MCPLVAPAWVGVHRDAKALRKAPVQKGPGRARSHPRRDQSTRPTGRSRRGPRNQYAYANRDKKWATVQQHSLGVELRISDRDNWNVFEMRGESHHDAYRFRQLVAPMNRVFRPTFHFPSDATVQLRRDQAALFV
ncbi:MAG: hypothetical protein JW940_07550 [Polyangiaceae bacterium]|nr:hypothetical protein [Polyangiaceae bacterium]